MADTLSPDQTRAMLEAVARHVIARTELLTEADIAIGDGDHGIGMRRGFEAALEKLAATEATTPADCFKAVGQAIMSRTGGAAGAVFGTLFRSGAKAIADRPGFDADALAAFLETGVEMVKQRGGVDVGEKTMVDALVPAAAAARSSTAKGLVACMAAASAGADNGAEATRDLVATTGKARSLGDRSLGHVDPGALSVSLILTAMKDYVAGVHQNDGKKS